MIEQYQPFTVQDDELKLYQESRWRDAYGIVGVFVDSLREVLRAEYAHHSLIDHALIEKAEEAYTQLVESDAAGPLYEAVETALPDTLHEFVTRLRDKSETPRNPWEDV